MPDMRASSRSTGAVGLGAAAAMAVVVGTSWLLAGLVGARFEDVSRDASASLGGPFYTGWLSQVVGLVWLVPAAVALVASVALHRAGRPAAALWAAGAVTAVMAVDDLFLLHEAVYPQAGVPEVAVFAVYGALVVALVARHRDRLGPDVWLVAGAVAMWAVSGLLDVALDTVSPVLAEDGAKAVGVALWAAMLTRLTLREIGSALPGLSSGTGTGSGPG